MHMRIDVLMSSQRNRRATCGQAKLWRHDERARPTHEDVVPPTSAATGHALAAIDKSKFAHPEPRRIMDHLRYVTARPCLIWGPHTCRSPSSALCAKPRTWPKGQ